MTKGKLEMFFSTGMCFLTLLVIITIVKRRNRTTMLEAVALCFYPLPGHGCVVESSRATAFFFPALVARFDSGITILHGIAPKNTGADHLSSYDATLVKRERKGAADCDTALAAAPSVNLPLNGTWLDYMTDMNQVENVIPQHYHLAIALPESKPLQVSA